MQIECYFCYRFVNLREEEPYYPFKSIIDSDKM